MKKILAVLSVFFLAFNLKAQTDVYNQGAEVTIFGAESVFINGSYFHTDTITGDAPVANNGIIELNGDLVNDTKTSLFTATNGTVRFSSDTGQSIRGITPIVFSELEVNTRDSSLVLEVDIEVNDSLILSAENRYGNLLLNNHNLDLGFTGYLTGETPGSRVFGDEGYLMGERTVPGGTGYETNLAGTGIGFGTPADPLTVSLGTVKFRRGHAPQSGATVKGGIRRFYILEPSITDQMLSTISVSYLDTVERKGLDESKFSIWKSTNQGAVWNREKLSSPVPAGDYVFADSVFITGQNIILTLGETDCERVPVVDLGADTMYLCPADSIVLDAANPGLFYKWSTGAATRTIPVVEEELTTADSVFHVRVTDANGCVGYDTVMVVKKPSPVIALKKTRLREVCLNDTSLFIVEDTIDTSGLDFHWDFGVSGLSSDTSDSPQASYIYAAYGTYTVQLNVTTEFGCPFDTAFVHTSHPLPVADFDLSDICLGEESLFYNQSSLNVPSPSSYALKSYSWDFGVPNEASDTAFYLSAQAVDPVTFTYSEAGSYTVSLITETSSGCTDTVAYPVEVFPLPDADFSLTSGVCNEDNIWLANNTVDTSGTFSWDWDFGDGFSSNLQQPEKSYEIPGDYTVRLTAITEHGCSDIDSAEVQIVEEPVASFHTTPVCLSDTALFVNLSDPGDYFWDFGNGDTSSVEHPVKVYPADGSYPVKLVVSTGAFCRDSITKTVIVYPLPEPQFSVSGDLCKDNTLTLVNTSQGASSYRWEFGDGNISTQAAPSHQYAAAGDKTISLTAWNSQGCSESLSQQIYVNDLPDIPVSSSITTCGSSYVLKLDDTTGLKQIEWNNSLVADSFMVSSSGAYRVDVISNENCEAGKDIQVTLNSIFKPYLGTDTAVCDEHTLKVEYPGSQKNWYFEGAFLSAASEISLSTSGIYSVEVTDQNNCTGTDSIDITVNTSPAVDLGPDIAFCPGGSETVTAGTAVNSYLWQPGGETTPSVTLDQPGTYAVTVTTPQNCQASDQISVSFHPVPSVDLGPDLMVCEPALLNAGNAGSFYEWSDASTDQTLLADQPGVYWVRVENPQGCSSSDTVSVTTAPKPVVDLGPDLVLCSGETAILDPANPGAGFLWSDGSTAQTLTVSASGTYQVQVTNDDNCSETDEIQVTVMPKVQVTLGSDAILCLGNEQVLDAGYPGSAYSWGSNTGFTATSQTVTVQDSGKYWVDIITPESCTGTDTIHITVSKDTVFAEYLAVSLIDEGDTVQFINLSTQESVDYFWDFGDGVTSTAEDPIHIFYQPNTAGYNVSLTVSNDHCSANVTKPLIVNPLKQDPDSSLAGGSFNEISDVRLYPNPARETATLEIDLKKEAPAYVAVFSSQGVLLEQFQWEGSAISKILMIRELASGVYFIKISINGDERVIRLVKL